MAKYPSSLDSIKKPNSQDQTVSKPWIFRCPICGSSAYDTVYDTSNAVFSSSSVVLYYECSQCSVMFKDPKKFTDVK